MATHVRGARQSASDSLRSRSLRVAALAAVIAPIGIVMSTANDDPVPVPQPAAQQGTVVWAGSVFLNRQDAVAWFAARGVSYESWARRHPAAARSLERP